MASQCVVISRPEYSMGSQPQGVTAVIVRKKIKKEFSDAAIATETETVASQDCILRSTEDGITSTQHYETVRTQHETVRTQHENGRTQHEAVRTQHESTSHYERPRGADSGESRAHTEITVPLELLHELTGYGSVATKLQVLQYTGEDLPVHRSSWTRLSPTRGSRASSSTSTSASSSPAHARHDVPVVNLYSAQLPVTCASSSNPRRRSTTSVGLRHRVQSQRSSSCRERRYQVEPVFQALPRDSPPPVLGSIGAEIRRTPKIRLHRQSLPEIGTKTCSLYSKMTDIKPQSNTKVHALNKHVHFSFGKDKTTNNKKNVMLKEGEIRRNRGLLGHALYGHQFESKNQSLLQREPMIRHKTLI